MADRETAYGGQGNSLSTAEEQPMEDREPAYGGQGPEKQPMEDRETAYDGLAIQKTSFKLRVRLVIEQMKTFSSKITVLVFLTTFDSYVHFENFLYLPVLKSVI